MQFQELTDKQWDKIVPHLPAHSRTGRPRADDRKMANAILYVCVTGCRWRDLPKMYGPISTAHKRLQDWVKSGTWEKIVTVTIEEDHRAQRSAEEDLS